MSDTYKTTCLVDDLTFEVIIRVGILSNELEIYAGTIIPLRTEVHYLYDLKGNKPLADKVTSGIQKNNVSLKFLHEPSPYCAMVLSVPDFFDDSFYTTVVLEEGDCMNVPGLTQYYEYQRMNKELTTLREENDTLKAENDTLKTLRLRH